MHEEHSAKKYVLKTIFLLAGHAEAGAEIMNRKRMKSILIVEDDAIIISGLIFVFEQEGYEVLHCGSVSEAKDAASDGRFSHEVLAMQLQMKTGLLITRMRQLMKRFRRKKRRAVCRQGSVLAYIN